MANCKNCLHSRVCFDSEGTTRYYGTEIAANNVEDLCSCFDDRSRYVVREKGEWKKVGKHDWRCTACGIGVPYEDTGHHFCPNCGADMRGAVNNG